MELRVNVGSTIIYVAGTVNGIEYLFDDMGFGQFRANVPRADDDLYHLDLQLIDEAGNRSEYVRTFEYFLPIFVYDRTEEDVKERTKKAYINTKDLNRIERNMAMVGGKVAALVSTKTDWQRGDLLRATDYERIRQNTAKIRAAYGVYSNTPQVPERPYNTYAKWNDIEKILHDVFFLYISNINSAIYCDDMYCGENGGL